MAGAGQPWYMPLLWPVAHVTNAIFKPETEKVPKNVAVAKLDVIGHLTAVFAALRSFTLAYGAIYWLYDDFDYPAFGAGTLTILKLPLSFTIFFPSTAISSKFFRQPLSGIS